MNPRTVVIIATKGRPEEVSKLLDALAGQTVLPDRIVVSACDPGDVSQGSAIKENMEVLFGPPGLPAQRNRALSLVRGTCDIIIFFDDDFIPSRFWIERVQMLMAAQPDVVSVTGKVLADGVKSGGLEWSNGQAIVSDADADLSKKMFTMNGYRMLDDQPAYGCNMAFRAKSIENLTFDEQLVLYGWLEDRDFSCRARAEGRITWTDAVWGVHLGVRRVRISGLRFGYSQVVNPWHLMKKGSMTPLEVWRYIFRALIPNTLGLFFLNSHVDRWGRLKGNLIGIKDIVFGRWAPERIVEL
jgi:glycosyltransferase involved in cell wall biosynthesis